MPHRPSILDRALSGLVVFFAETAVAIAAIVLALVVALVITVLV